jgi:integrase
VEHSVSEIDVLPLQAQAFGYTETCTGRQKRESATVTAGILSSNPDVRGHLVDDDPRRFGFHNLRHSLASFLIRIRTDPKTVQTLLRHSDVKLTLQFYTHTVSRDRMVAAGKMLSAILSHAPDKNGLRAD